MRDISVDVWVSDVLKEVLKGVATYATIKEVKALMENKVPKEKIKELRKRVSATFRRLDDNDLVVKLKDYPGLIPLLKDESFRKGYYLRDDVTWELLMLSLIPLPVTVGLEDALDRDLLGR